MKIVTPNEMKEIDRKSIHEIGIPGPVLMENAALKVFNVAMDMLGGVRAKRILIFAGKGNNGGDGLAAARHLKNHGAHVEIFLLGDKNSLSGDAKLNFSIIINMDIPVYEILSSEGVEHIKTTLHGDLVIDALLGTGISGAVKPPISDAIKLINDSGIPILSVDIPSGINGENGTICETAVRANQTVTFALPKRGHFLYPGAEYTGKLIIEDIGIPEKVVESENIKGELVTYEHIQNLIKKRERDTHKGTYGKVFILAGSTGFTGAAYLVCQSALKSGSGLIVLGIPESLNPIMEVKLTEPMTLPLPEGPKGTLKREALPIIMEQSKDAKAIAAGPGLSTHKEIGEIIRTIIKNAETPIVLDADALNVLAEAPDILKSKKTPVIITPHPGEMARLLNTDTPTIQKNRITAAVETACRWKVMTVLKGANTIIAEPDGHFYINTTGNPGMATGGSGDVLTGIIVSFLGQGMAPLDAALAGVYIHGLAGYLAAKTTGEWGLTAGNIVESLAKVIVDFEEKG